MVGHPAVAEIVSPLVRRHRAGKASIILVTYPGIRAPRHLVQEVSIAIQEAGMRPGQVRLSELAPNPVSRLVELKQETPGVEIFSIDCGVEQLKYGTLISALNIHRNTFARERLCAVFWLPRHGMHTFAQQASNFLDFRTRLVEVDTTGQPLRHQPASALVLAPTQRPTPSRWRGNHAAFIIFSHRYRGWAEVLKTNIEICLDQADVPGEVFLNEVALGAGFSWIRELQTGLDQAQHVVLVVSPEALVSPRVLDEWAGLVKQRSDWAKRLHLALLVDTPLPPFLVQIKAVDFRQANDSQYRNSLCRLVENLLGFDLQAGLPNNLQFPKAPQLSLPSALRRNIIEGLAPILESQLFRRSVATSLGLERYALDGQPSLECAASAALAQATGDDDPAEAARRVLGVLVEEFKEEDSAYVSKLRQLQKELAILPEVAKGGLLQVWLDMLVRQHGRLLPFFEQHHELVLLDLIYVQQELRASHHLAEPRIIDHPRTLREILALDPTKHPWITLRWVLRGDPGAGKTTLLRYLAGALAQETKPSLVPVFESLPRLIREPEWFLDRMAHQLRRSGLPSQGLPALLDRLGDQGRLLLLLDGLDEVPQEDRAEAEALLRELSIRWPQTPLVVTTRPIGYRSPGAEFLELELLPLDRSRRHQFLTRWFGRRSGVPDELRAEQAVSLLEQDRNLWELAGNPLYLSLFAILLEEGLAPATNRAQLYDQMLSLLLDGRHRPTSEPIAARHGVRQLLRYLAYSMTQDNLDAVPILELERYLYQPAADVSRDILERVPRWRKNMRLVLDDIAERTGILGPHDGAKADWRFWHRTFREALAAEWLEEAYRAAGYPALLEHVHTIAGDESRWAEPYALLAARIEDPNDLVKTLVRENQALGLRAMATAQGLSGDTLQEILDLTDNWSERVQVYTRIPDLLGEPMPTLALLDRLRQLTRNGNDLYFLDAAARETTRRWPGSSHDIENFRNRIYDHIPKPPEDLFRSIDTPEAGHVDFWRSIPAGNFLMGSPAHEGQRDEDEGPRHAVEILAPFHMTAGPITNEQYAAFDPDHSNDEMPHHPATNVSWYAATSFCRWLASVGYPGARLAGEEEWEYACRAGTSTRYWIGDLEEDLERIGWFNTNSGWRPHHIGEKLANPWGLYDVHGNVWEWTSSPWSHDYSNRESGVAIDPSRNQESDDLKGIGRVIRGGGYGENAARCRSAYRKEEGPSFEGRDLGFRVVLPVIPKS